MSRFVFDLSRPGTVCRDGRWRKASHAETFTEPMEYSAGLANANIATSADGKPLHTPDGKLLLLFPAKGSPGTFGKVKGKLVKAKAQSSIKSQRWHHPHEQAKTTAHAMRRERFLTGWLAHKPQAARVKVKDLEHAVTTRGDAEQKRRLAEYFYQRQTA